MTAYTVTLPTRPHVALRLHAMPIASLCQPDLLKVSLQSIDHGHVIAEDPLSVEWMSPAALEVFIDDKRRQGWVIEKVGPVAKQAKFIPHRNAA